MTELKPPTLLVDTDALINLDPWEGEAQQKRLLHFFLHIAEAQPRNPQLLSVAELAQAEGIKIAYSSRWPELCSYLVRPWLQHNGFPEAFINWRRSGWTSPAELGAIHAAAAGRRGSVLMLHNDECVAGELRQRFGIAALTPAQLPATADGLRKVFSLARVVAPFELPKRQPNRQSRREREEGAAA